MLDYVETLEAAGAACAFEPVSHPAGDPAFAALFNALQNEGAEALAAGLGLRPIMACVVIAPDQGEVEPATESPQHDDDGREDDGDDRTQHSPD